jgi:hypothetical protein
MTVTTARRDRGGPFGPAHPDRNPDGTCWGFRWVGQSLTTCDTCGDPYWVHDYDIELRADGWHRRPVTVAIAAAVRRKWDQ